MPQPTFQFSAPSTADGRIDAPAFHRNHAPMWSVLSRFLSGKSGDVLEIGSGTGQHVVAFARATPDLTWWPSDPDERHRRSIAGWISHSGLANVRSPQALDLAAPGWAVAGAVGFPETFTAVFCANVIHVAPWSIAQGLFGGVASRLVVGARLFLYGPFKRGGVHTAESNAAFDRNLRERNPEWGVRDMDDVAGLAHGGGLRLAETTEMPANNFLLSFERVA
jgi:SAM-dependent methyltransferase